MTASSSKPKRTGGNDFMNYKLPDMRHSRGQPGGGRAFSYTWIFLGAESGKEGGESGGGGEPFASKSLRLDFVDWGVLWAI